ncbi:hypothetical protein [Actinomadura latina]|uniref:Uncharacterized protein n=1 Tax=Actinomadura latina TaxID=163603 RepID=A0A846Z9Q1_9ACTN|nr:hypothetical protein [Actinomadura latina]NKZ07474.1 hypothetical protein [Actinomadura latina]
MVSDPSGSGDRWARLLAALEDDCAACGGTGRTPNPRWLAWHRRAAELVAVAQAARRAHELRAVAPGPASGGARSAPGEPGIVAAVDRAIDDHMAARPAEPEEDTCAACGGMGRELTAAGRQLAELLARYGFVRDA